jgi:signal transduction histidine kinase
MDVTDWIHAQDAIAAGRERLKTLARKVVFAQEEERRRISSELHDEAGQALTALSISLKLHAADIEDAPPEVRKKLNDTIALVTTTMDQIRLLAQGLRPQSLDALGINNTLEGCCRDFSRRTQIEIEYQGVEVESLPDITAISLYRFLQEALTNAAKHARASKVKVTLTQEDSLLALRVEDDGVGFLVDPGGLRSGDGVGGIGLLGMRERIEMLGGRMDIISALGQGAALTALVDINGDPIERRRKHDPSRSRG